MRTLLKRMPITPAGYQKLQEELKKLLKVERPKNIKDISEARAHGDLSENAEYHAAKERQSFIEGRIQDLTTKLALADVIDPSMISQDRIAFGATVKVLDVATDEEKVFQLVGQEEADVKNGRISIISPVGRALLNKEIGDVVTIKAPAKTMEYEILEIRFE
ncbi:MAG: transcription elongation factor GreA [Thermodesulfovibrionales bacterium]|nr:transcription elongation factor GreA [Thermodesulfovibrionales bacterium]